MAWKRKNGSASGSPARGAGAGYEEAEKVPRGHVPMLVAGGDDDGDGGQRVLVPVRLLSDPSIAELLDMAAQRYGYGQPGVLRVPCDAGHFRQVLDGAMHRCGISLA
ncbi:auxin-responsive protein SAUR40 [Zea mays]|jgi:SAUR family protein|uniref:Auxin responsive protein n=1 Tax=Zea mays TaxID=4577 RepID=A0A1D6GL11_MAIZE|nr:auxin-responsive protein SAUR40 [Zea mays]AQK64010.1 Auxin responsive protein [Zea mays]|eukprot:XP_020393205.1 auxin-responsive protein SAUR40 [Zea mays]